MNSYINIEKENLKIVLDHRFVLTILDRDTGAVINISPEVTVEFMSMCSTIVMGLAGMSKADVFQGFDDFK